MWERWFPFYSQKCLQFSVKEEVILFLTQGLRKQSRAGAKRVRAATKISKSWKPKRTERIRVIGRL